MFAYYLKLAWRSLQQQKMLTALMVLAIAVGIGASMTTLTTYYVLAGDPIPQKSKRLFYPQLDAESMRGFAEGREPERQLTRYDAEALLKDAKGERQAFMSGGSMSVSAPQKNIEPMFYEGRYSTADIFALFDIPFIHGSGWSAEQDEARAQVAVITNKMNQKLFEGANSVGETVVIDGHEFRIIGVITDWSAKPMFYDMTRGRFQDREMVYLPFWTARSLSLNTQGNMNCWGDLPEGDPEGQKGLNAPCSWLQYWVEMDPSQADEYKRYLENYSDQQREAGRFERPTNVRLHDVMGWLDYNNVIPSDVRLQVWLAFGFLFVCLFNTIGLLLTKFMRRAGTIGVRRALGASKRSIFTQLLLEAGMIGFMGGLLGLAFAHLGLWIARKVPTDYSSLLELDGTMMLITFVVAIGSVVMASLLPAWRAAQITPAIQLKTQ